MKVSEIMTRDVCLAKPDEPIRRAAEMMEKMDVGSLPVTDGDRLVGIVTDRDIVVRGLAHGLDAESPVREVMTKDIKYCYEDDDVDDVARNMADLEVRRLPVVNRDKRLVGFVSLANFAHSNEQDASERLLKGVARPHDSMRH
ncbi:CBS domain-containing protein [Vulcaniibacterium tengchongense]|uniref:CBS domain-containing protein n=1 Tax=Vulcaniibacterium tengchongense TaxID=1273429 RepID=A0A3N4VB32_9GAMM|nr:CBS domain-containing protein [Vulcaniibacterium tengchongense]RPE76911.1 CBS domain-containing protein [Vulcaniibacterium tengchongense]